MGEGPDAPDTYDDRTLTRVARGGLLGGAGAAVNGVISFLVIVVVTRGFTASTAGSLFAASSVFLIVVAIVELGVDTGLVHWMPRYTLDRHWPQLRNCLAAALLPAAVMALLGGVALAAVGTLIAHVTASGDSSGTTVQMLRALAPFVPAAAMHDLLLATTRAHRTIRPTVFIERIGRGGAQLLAVLCAYAAGASPSWLAVAWAAPYVPALAASAFWARRWYRRAITAGEPDPTVAGPAPRTVLVTFWTYTLSRAGARICQVALQRADIVLVAALRTPREAAIYTAATRFLVVGLLAVQAIQQVIQPHLSHALARKDGVAVGRMFRVSTVWIVAATWPPYLLMATYSHFFLKAFGSGYSGGRGVLVLLALVSLFATAAGPLDVVLTMAGRSALSLANGVISLAVDIGLDLVLIPHIGITGAAIGWATAIVVRNLLPLLQIRYLLHLSAASPALVWVAVAATLNFGVIPLALHAASETLALAMLPLLVGTYCWVLWRYRDRTDMAIVIRALRRRRPNPVSVVSGGV